MEEYDYVVFGTGIIESLIASEIAINKKKILIIDNNRSYGSDIVTLSYNELIKKFNSESIPELSKISKNFNIDIIPKIFLVNGGVQHLMKKYEIENMINFRLIEGSFIHSSNKTLKIPMDEKSSLKSSLVGFWEKPKLIKFFWSIRKYTDGFEHKFMNTTSEEFQKYGLNEKSQEFIGHAIALNLDNTYLQRHPKELYDKIILYISSLVSSGNSISPYIYPEYGLSEIPQFLSRVASINGAVYRLDTNLTSYDVDENENYILDIVDFEGKNVKVKTKNIISNPIYFKDDVVSLYKIIRCICILKGECELVKGYKSANVVFLSSDLNRKNDIFLVVLGNSQKVCPKDYKIAIISTIQETDSPENEIEVITSKMNNIMQKFIYINDIYDMREEVKGFYITKTTDHNPSFESEFEEYNKIINRIRKDF